MIDDMKGERKPINEEWREVPGYPGYEASSLGRIARDKFVCKQSPPTKGFLYYSVYVPLSMTKKKQSWECVHKLVILAFHAEQPPDTVAMHLNGDPLNNRADNLRWGTWSEVIKRRL